MKNSAIKSILILALIIVSNFCIFPGMKAMSASSELADIASYPGIEIAGTGARWGGRIRLNSEDALYSENGKCIFRYDLGLMNTGNTPTGEFGYRIDLSGWKKEETHPGILSNEESITKGVIELKPGKQKLVLKLDNNDQINESDEINNVPFALHVEVKGKCNSENRETSIIATK